MAEKEFTFKLVASLDDLTKALHVRFCVFVEEMQIPYSEEFDGLDQSALHVMGMAKGEPFATARIRHLDGAARIERLCVRKSYRAKGLGDRLLSFVISLTEQTGYTRCSVLAEGMLVQWYRNHGFQIERTVKRADGSECFEMARTAGKPQEELPAKEVKKPLESIIPPKLEKKAKESSPKSSATDLRCAVSNAPFEITDQDRTFYKKMGVPPPKLSPQERARRRMAFANQRNLFVRNCAGSGKRIVTNYPPEAIFPVYDVLYWLSDAWDQFASQRPYDFKRPFFEQFAELMQVAPRPNLQREPSDENCDYTNYAGKNKNCYLIFDSDNNKECCHCYSISSCVDTVDCFRVEKSELCYECVDCTNCYSSTFLQNCENCSDSAFLKNCIGCKHCFGSVNLRNKSYYFENEKLSKDAYQEELKAVRLDRYSMLKQIRPQFAEQALLFPHKALQGVQNENVLGDYLTNCKNALHCFDSRALWDCKYVLQAFDNAKDCIDCVEIGNGAELLYECCYGGYNAHFNRFCSHTYVNTSNLTYCSNCSSCADCFGCIGLHHAKYCILNTQYSEADYKALLPKIIAHMESTGEWGEFFPPQVSPFPYNLTHAHEYSSLAKSEATARGYRWQDSEQKEYQPSVYQIPDAIEQVQDDILQALLACEVTGKNYKLQKAELLFYRKMNIPVPRLCPDERHTARLKLRNSRKFYKRKCTASGREIITTIPSDSPIEVLCEEEYLKLLE